MTHENKRTRLCEEEMYNFIIEILSQPYVDTIHKTRKIIELLRKYEIG